MFWLGVLLACEAEVVDTVDPGPEPDVMAVEVRDCTVGEFAEFPLGDGEAVAAFQCEAETDACYQAVYNRLGDGTVRVPCSEQYEYARVVVIYPGA